MGDRLISQNRSAAFGQVQNVGIGITIIVWVPFSDYTNCSKPAVVTLPGANRIFCNERFVLL